MEEKSKNKLFSFFVKEHDLPLTGDEIEEIIKKVGGYDDMQIVKHVKVRLSWYRAINAVILFMMVFPVHMFVNNDRYWILLIAYVFISYNVLHVLIEWIIEYRKRLKKANENS